MREKIAHKLSRSALFWLLLFMCLLSPAIAKPVSVQIKASEQKDAETLGNVELYQDSYALVIGIDEYTNGWPRLSNGVKDAELVAEVLTQQGYTVDLRKNLDSKTLGQALKNFFIVRGANPNARLILWYAGHGQTIKGEGFLVAADTPAREDPSFKLSAIHMRDFGGWVRLAESKHVLAVFDSCFAGTIFSSQRGAPPASITRATTYPVRQFITSGDADQLVLDNGTFRELFVRALNGEENADINFDGYLTASELGFFLSDRVTNLTQAQQTPRYGKLRDRDYDRGDFVLAVLRQQQNIVDKSVAVQAMETENLLWNSVLQIDTLAAYQRYLERFPRGHFADLAAIRIQQFEQQNQTAEPVSRSPAAAEYRIEAVKEKTVYLQRDAAVFQTPDNSGQPVLSLTKGTQAILLARVEGLNKRWSQLRFQGQTVFVLSDRISEKAPRKSMAELIKEKKQEQADYLTRNGQANTTSRNLSYQYQQCIKNCANQSYLRMDTAAEQRAEQLCSARMDTVQYEDCMDKAQQAWRARSKKHCEKQC